MILGPDQLKKIRADVEAGVKVKRSLVLSALETAISLVEAKKKDRWRKVTFCSVFVSAMLKAKHYAKANATEVVPISKLKLNNKEYARFNDLVRFGFTYKTDDMANGEHGLYVDVIDDFMKGRTTVSAYFMRDPKSKAFVLSPEKITIKDVPSVKEAAAVLGEKLTSYERPPL